MARSVAVINKDIAQHYRLANLLSPPEAIELTQLHDQMSEILNRQTRNENDESTNLDMYFKLLFKYMKLLNILKFGEETNEPLIKPNQPIEPKVKIERRPSTIVRRRNVKPPAPLSLPLVTTPTNPIAAAIAKDSPEPPQLIQKSPPPLSKPTSSTSSKPSIDEIKDHVDSLFPHTSNELEIKALKLIKQNDPTFKLISKFPSHQIHIKGKIYSTKTISDVLDMLGKPDFSTNDLTEPDEKFFFQHVFIPNVTQNVTKHAQDVIQNLPGFNAWIARQQRSSRAATHAAKTKGTGIKNRISKIKPVGKIHLKRWQSYIT